MVKQIAWNTGSGNITLTYTGQGDGTISVLSDENNGAARSQAITIQTLDGVVTRNLTVSQAACPIPVGTVLNYAYTGSYQEVELPAGQYKLQCWGAQGGSNATASSYGISAKAGGKGGYSEGVLTLTSKTTVRIYVGGAGSSSAGGFNGGGSTSGSASYSSGDIQGVSRMGGGGGATDIRLSDGALLSRMIVAGGGGGGAMCYRKKTTTTTTWQTLATLDLSSVVYSSTTERTWTNLGNGWWCGAGKDGYSKVAVITPTTPDSWFGLSDGDVIRVKTSESVYNLVVGNGNSTNNFESPYSEVYSNNSVQWTVSKSSVELLISVNKGSGSEYHGTITIEKQESSSSTTEDNDSQVGFAGGGTTGGGYSSTYQGKQNAAGSGGSFGQGANQTTTNYRYCSGAGGGGWYGGGGGQYSDSSMTYCKYSGGGSGFVNIAANASYRPSGYTGLELDSGETKAGNTSFPSTSGGTETGHSGNGYARITRLS